MEEAEEDADSEAKLTADQRGLLRIKSECEINGCRRLFYQCCSAKIRGKNLSFLFSSVLKLFAFS
jgi:hypothetical protein